jgi:diphthine-ammonia ligase
MKAVALFSGGKDSLYATYLAERQGVTIDHLITLLPTLPQPSPHAKNIEALKLIAKSTGKHLTIIDFRKENAFIETLKNLEVDALVAGDIYVEPHRRGLEDVCKKTGLKLLEPLYGRDTLELFHEIFNSGFTALITGVNLEVIGEEFLGYVINKDTGADFLSRIGSVDPLGENGEFHTLVLACPLYQNSFELKSMKKIREGGVAYLVVSIA